MASSTASPFLSLPAEMRNEIYCLAFTDTTVILSTTKYSRHRTTYISSSGDEVAGLPGILLANKQTHSETRLLIYSTAKFVATSADPLTRWLKSLGAETRRSVKRVCLRGSSPGTWTLSFNPSGLPQVAHKRGNAVKHMLSNMKIAIDGAAVEYEFWSNDGERKIWPLVGQVEDA